MDDAYFLILIGKTGQSHKSEVEVGSRECFVKI